MPREWTMVKNTTSSGPSQRQLRVGEILRHTLAGILARGQVMDPDLEGKIITIPEVRLSPDLKIATVYVMPLGGVGGKVVVKALARNVRYLKGELGKQLKGMKSMPDLRFRFDEQFDEAARIDKLLHDPRVTRDLDQPKDGSDDE
ncbi:MAG: 30S ribosome-binding factor RbfA [Beijerinckiaceae bacterium]